MSSDTRIKWSAAAQYTTASPLVATLPAMSLTANATLIACSADVVNHNFVSGDTARTLQIALTGGPTLSVLSDQRHSGFIGGNPSIVCTYFTLTDSRLAQGGQISIQSPPNDLSGAIAIVLVDGPSSIPVSLLTNSGYVTTSFITRTQVTDVNPWASVLGAASIDIQTGHNYLYKSRQNGGSIVNGLPSGWSVEAEYQWPSPGVSLAGGYFVANTAYKTVYPHAVVLSYAPPSEPWTDLLSVRDFPDTSETTALTGDFVATWCVMQNVTAAAGRSRGWAAVIGD